MRNFGLIGYPLQHSFSPAYWAERFQQLGLTDAAYRAYELPSVDDLRDFVVEHDLRGLNVTIPHKRSVLPLLDQLSPEAQTIGAVNCIDIEEGQLVGYNTDAFGFEQSLRQLLGESTVDSTLVMGTGGASKAVCYVLDQLGIEWSYVSRRRPFLTYSELTPAMVASHRLLINTTPLGTFPDIHRSPDIPYHAISSHHYCYDLVYNPTKTLFLDRAEGQGAAIKNGYEMLILQAERSWEIWNQ